MASQLLGILSSLIALERLKQHHGRLAASHLDLSRWSWLGFIFAKKVAFLLSNEVAAHHARLRDVVTSVSSSLELDLWSNVKVPRVTK